MGSRRLGIIGILLLAIPVASFASVPPGAPAPAVSGPRLKAAFIYNFIKFVEWPAARSASRQSFDIAVVDDPEVEAALRESMIGMRVADHPVVVRRVVAPESLVAAAGEIDILFVGREASNSMAAWRRALGDQPVLTVGDSEEFWAGGGAMDFLVRGGRMRFRVNLGSADTSGLKISSKLLALAVDVKVSGAR